MALAHGVFARWTKVRLKCNLARQEFLLNNKGTAQKSSDHRHLLPGDSQLRWQGVARTAEEYLQVPKQFVLTGPLHCFHVALQQEPTEKMVVI